MEQPAKHSVDARNDKIAISRISDWITSSGYAVPNFESYGTWPNYDGIIDLIDSDSCPKGSLLAQVKKLPIRHNMRYTFKDKGKFLTYCRENASWTPILLIGVDLKKNRAYWLHMSEGLLSQLGESQTIYFKEAQSISADNLESIRSWHIVVERYATIARERIELEAQVTTLMQRTESNLIGVARREFTKLHMFLDEFNRLLDHDFSIVKKVYYPNAWKLGIAYAEYTPNTLSYLLYPILSTVNDVAIKKLNPATFQPFRTKAAGATWHFGNPLEQNPHDYAKGLVRKRVEYILKSRLLDHSGIVTLAREYLFAYVDKYSEQLGLSKKDSYTVKELEEAFVNYYPRWLFAAKDALEVQRSNLARSRQLDSDSVGPKMTLPDPDCIVFLDDASRKNIHQQVASQIAAQTVAPSVVFIDGKLSAAIFARMLDYVKQKGIKKVIRLYMQKDFSLLHSKNSSLIWDAYSPTARLYNLKRVAIRFESIYNKIVSNNFPQISRPLALVEPGNRLVYVYDSAEETDASIPPGAAIYEIIANKTQPRKPATFLLASAHKIDIKGIDSKQMLCIDGEYYELVSRSETSLDFWILDTPLLDMVYRHLELALDEYFRRSFNNSLFFA